MQDINFKQHITVKNLVLAFVALNILSVVSTVHAPMHTFKVVSDKPIERAVKPARPHSASPAEGDLIDHIMPGEAAPPRAERPTVALPRSIDRPLADKKPKRSNGLTLYNWLGLAMAFGTVLYMRYLLRKAVEHAVTQIKSYAMQAWQGRTAKPAAPYSRPVRAPPPSAAVRAPNLAKASSPRQSGGTVVRASRWPFGA